MNHNNQNDYKNEIKIIEAVMVFIFDENKNILLLKRIDNGQWEPVKGGIDFGESWSEAALREIKEETGLTLVFDLKFFNIVDDELDTAKAKKTKIRGHVGYCFVSEVSPEIDLAQEEELEHNDYRWISISDIESELIYPPLAKKMLLGVIRDFKINEL